MIHIIGFVFGKSRVDRVAIEVLEQQNNNLIVTGEVLEILPMQSQDESTNSSWAWSLSYLSSSGKGKSSKLTVGRATFRFPGWLIIPLCPTLYPATSIHDNPFQPYTWVFEEEVLEESLSQLWSFVEERYPDKAQEALGDLPSLSIDELPHQSGGSTLLLLISTAASQSDIIPFLPQTRSAFASTPSSQDTVPEFCNEILRFHVWSAVKITFPETCEHMLDDISSTTYVAKLSKRVERYLYMSLCARATLISLQLGLEPCGFCGGDGSTVKLDCMGQKQFKIVSSCHYAYVSFNYERAKLPTKSSPCSNIPIACPYCNTPDGAHFIWKYNAVTHMATNHPDEVLPLELLAQMHISQMHISLTEAEFMKADQKAMKSCRKLNDLMDSDDLPDGMGPATKDKRSRALSASSAGGSRKNPRLE